jgi:hypothetical protein
VKKGKLPACWGMAASICHTEGSAVRKSIHVSLKKGPVGEGKVPPTRACRVNLPNGKASGGIWRTLGFAMKDSLEMKAFHDMARGVRLFSIRLSDC